MISKIDVATSLVGAEGHRCLGCSGFRAARFGPELTLSGLAGRLVLGIGAASVLLYLAFHIHRRLRRANPRQRARVAPARPSPSSWAATRPHKFLIRSILACR